MNRILILLSLLVTGHAALAAAAEPTLPDLDKLVGQSVDLAPWAYCWRADRKTQALPEAYFIPHRLARLDAVYRTALAKLGKDQIKSRWYTQNDLLTPLPPVPKGQLLTGLLWVGGLSNYQVELCWPPQVKVLPSPKTVEVRSYPTAWGWFGWTVDQILGEPEISADGRTWLYRPKPGATMDWAYNRRVPGATEMVAVFSEGQTPVPTVRVTGPNLGHWKRMDVEIEWGFQDATQMASVDGRLELHMALAGPIAPLAGDNQTKVTGQAWQSPGAKANRRGIRVPLLYAPDSRSGSDSRITIWTGNTGFTVRLSDLDAGPMLVPQHGFFVTRAGGDTTARQFATALASRQLKSVRQMVREHHEAASWEEAIREVRLWRCPAGTTLKPFPATPKSAMQIDVPDTRWVAMWELAAQQLRGPHMWGNLAAEVAPVAHAMEMTGLQAEADKIYNYFLPSPGVKADGDFVDGTGSLEWAKSMKHDMAYSHEGAHFSSGRLLYSMAERFFLTGDRAWLAARQARLQAAADWIIRQRRDWLKDIPNRDALHVAGLLPPSMMGDYALPACDWHWYYFDNVFALQGLASFAEALAALDPAAAARYRLEAEEFRQDIRRAALRDAALSPVRRGRDGIGRSYIPIKAYARGLMNTELGAPQYGGGRPMDLMLGALPLAMMPAPVLEAGDRVLVDTLDVLEETATSTEAVQQLENERKNKQLPVQDAWFWLAAIDLPKWSFNASVYLLQDDVPNFLRFWVNESVSMVGADGKLWEHWRPNSYEPCNAPDNGTAGWFLINFRNLLVMEQDGALWLAKGTPRAWLEQGKKISVKNAPTHFGTVAYEIVSDVDNGKISATVELPSRKAPASVQLRFRHPKAAPIKSVTVNGRDWKNFNTDKETIELKGLTGTVTVTANY